MKLFWSFYNLTPLLAGTLFLVRLDLRAALRPALSLCFCSQVMCILQTRHASASECALSELPQNRNAVKEHLYFPVGLWRKRDCKSYPLLSSHLANPFWLLSSLSIPLRKLSRLQHAFHIRDLNCEYKRGSTRRTQFGQDVLLL